NYILPGKSGELSGIYWDTFLPIQGPNSIAHRSLVIYKYNRTDVRNITSTPWACGTILQYIKKGIYQKPMLTAQILFRYPIVGRILFRQPKDEPWQDTIIIVEYLIHADGSTEDSSDGHRWAIHNDAPGKDFYDWQNRCISTEESSIPLMCRLGDTYSRLGKLTIAGGRHEAAKLSRKVFVDSNLPLSGRFNIIGKSLTIYDDFGPKARGERLACSTITGHSRRKAVAKDWYPNGNPFSLTGKLEITQQSEYDITNVEVEFKGLEENSGYHIHQ
uniref:Superoxide dismutase copper/zinc binding domain-containing protein n=1 Tax=Megaselia scalaris TaxID=36166 RepID=T1H2Q3_MEGSC